jgi:hypothetical protein
MEQCRPDPEADNNLTSHINYEVKQKVDLIALLLFGSIMKYRSGKGIPW